MAMKAGQKVEGSLQDTLLQAIKTTGQLGDFELRQLGFNPLEDLNRLNALIYQINLSIAPDKIIKTKNGSSGGRRGLNPVIIYESRSNG